MVDKQGEVEGGEFGGDAGILTPAGVCVDMVNGKDARQNREDGFNQLAGTGQPGFESGGPGLVSIVGWDSNDMGGIGGTPMVNPALAVKSFVGDKRTLFADASCLNRPDMSERRLNALSARGTRPMSRAIPVVDQRVRSTKPPSTSGPGSKR